MTIRRQIVRLVAITVLTPVVYLISCQSRMIYFPRPYDEGALDRLSQLDGRQIEFQTAQGAQTAFYVPPRSGDPSPAPLWLCFSGNGALAMDWLHAITKWDGRFSYLLIDYPGYGDCAGKPSPRSIRESSTAAFAALAQHLNENEKSLLARSRVLGHSLGAAAALQTAEDLDLRRGVLISPFTSMTEMGRRSIGWPLCHLNLHRFDNRATLRTIARREGARISILHGIDDEIIPVQMARDLSRPHSGTVTLRELPGLHHNDIIDRAAQQIGEAMMLD
jgi:pimeloyl-ACP methyl ester carboxylesterase